MEKKLGLRDFRVGNLVEVCGNVGVVNLSSVSHVVIQVGKNTYCATIDAIKKIDVTCEILDKNFTRIIDSIHTKIPVWELDKNRDISIFKENEFFLQVNDNEPVKLESVRELQNHLWMLGLDDSIII